MSRAAFDLLTFWAAPCGSDEEAKREAKLVRWISPGPLPALKARAKVFFLVRENSVPNATSKRRRRSNAQVPTTI